MTPLLKSIKWHCTDLLINSRCNSFQYHNLNHTLEVYENVLKIGCFEKRDLDEIELVMIAALFHDTGMANSIKDHEDYSVAEALSYLKGRKYPTAKIRIVVDCINATRSDIKPVTVLEAILCDADGFHLGSDDFLVRNNQLRNEWSMYHNRKYTDLDWLKLNIAFLKEHRFYTKFGHQILRPGKLEIIGFLESKLQKIQ